MITEMFFARGSFSSRSSENVGGVTKRTSEHKLALTRYDGGARAMLATVRFLAFFRVAQARYRLVHRPRSRRPIFIP